jgi:hypothetical protein
LISGKDISVDKIKEYLGSLRFEWKFYNSEESKQEYRLVEGDSQIEIVFLCGIRIMSWYIIAGFISSYFGLLINIENITRCSGLHSGFDFHPQLPKPPEIYKYLNFGKMDEYVVSDQRGQEITVKLIG